MKGLTRRVEERETVVDVLMTCQKVESHDLWNICIKVGVVALPPQPVSNSLKFEIPLNTSSGALTTLCQFPTYSKSWNLFPN